MTDSLARPLPFWWRWPWRYLRQVVLIPSEFVYGFHYGFPVCCNLRFCLDLLFDVPAFHARGATFKKTLNRHNEDGLYVPCPSCAVEAKRMGSWRAP